MRNLATINDVLARLESIIEWAKNRHSPLGYFPVVYHLMTQAVQKGIVAGIFEDGVRMERLDVLFAQRYFDAFEAWQNGQPTTLAWQWAFEATSNNKVTVLQHMLLGINAHISLDLGIAAAQTCPGAAIQQLRGDFDQINATIAGLVDPMQERLTQIFPVLWIADRLFRSQDERLANSLVQVGRQGAWTVATTLAGLAPDHHPTAIRALDNGVAALSATIASPASRLLAASWRIVRWSELGSVASKMEKLQGKMQWTPVLESALQPIGQKHINNSATAT